MRTMSLYKTFYKLWDTLGENEGVETFAVTLDRADAINVKKIPLPASQDKSKDTICQQYFEVVT